MTRAADADWRKSELAALCKTAEQLLDAKAPLERLLAMSKLLRRHLMEMGRLGYLFDCVPLRTRAHKTNRRLLNRAETSFGYRSFTAGKAAV